VQAVTRPDQNQWGIASSGASSFSLTPNSAYSAIWRVPNNSRLDASGKLIKDVETDEFKAAVGFSRDIWQAGLWHPNTPNYGGTYNPDFWRPVCLWSGRPGASTSNCGISKQFRMPKDVCIR
jgi:hypothetical protein